MVHHERSAEAGAEGDLRFDAQADFRARDLAGIAGDEVVDGLVGSEPRDGRHHAGSVAGEEDDVLRMAGALLRESILDKGERISRAGVLRHRVVVQIHVAGDGVVNHVLDDGPEAACGGEDLRLGLGRESNDLGVATVLEIEDAVVTPAMFVVADQAALGVGGQGGLAGAGEAEEDGHITVRPHVGRAVHGQDALERQHEIEHREDGLFDFPGIVRAADDGQALAEIQDDESVGACAVHHGRSQEARHSDHREFRHVLLQFVLITDLQEHGAGEEAVPGLLGDDTDGHGIIGIGTDIAILHEDVAALQVALQARQ